MAPKKPAAVTAEAVPAVEPAVFVGGPGGEAIPEQAAALEPDTGGWFRNTTAGDLTVMGAPSMTIPAGEVRFLPYTPAHRGLELTAAPDPAALDEDVPPAPPATSNATPTNTPAEELTP